MTDITRRTLVQAGGALGLSAGLVSTPMAQPADGRTAYRFFTPEEAAFIEAAVDRLIPPEPDWPGAREAGVPNYIDLQLAGPYGQGQNLFLAGPIKPGTPSQGYQLGLTPVQVYRTALGAILRRLQEAGASFEQATREEQDAFLHRLEAGEVDLDGVPSAVFFETLFANTIEGFFSDPAYGGNRDMVGWRMVGFPGVYAAYLGVYTQHGLRYGREPLSMADAQRLHGHGPAPAHGAAPASLDRHP
ncbi:gluconate 2-dehydrogenase subunit 3 family protein [Microvirga sp. M2]|uniref:gluconate 2-dehydrogenase subunit 3 family protein n=1 Tax=Microvirga sp. M2 TaxID=3073270 RepID=UPI0039C392DF